MTRALFHTLSRYRFLILLVSLLSVAILHPIISELDLTRARFLLSIFIPFVLLSSAYAVSENKRLLTVTLCLAVVATGAKWVTDFVQGLPSWFIVTTLILLAACLFLVSAIILVDVFKEGRVTGEKISAAICVYLLIGLIWAYLFSLTFVLKPESFRIDNPSLSHFVYYSYITLSTLGYGDITPLTPTTRTLAYLEAILGQIYLTVLVARLVGLHIAHREGK